MSYALHTPISRACTCLQYVFSINVTCMFLGRTFDIASFTWPLADAKETQGSKLRQILRQIRLKKTDADKVLATQEEQRQLAQSLEETVKDLSAKVKQFQSEVDSMILEKDEALEKIQSDSADGKKESVAVRGKRETDDQVTQLELKMTQHSEVEKVEGQQQSEESEDGEKQQEMEEQRQNEEEEESEVEVVAFHRTKPPRYVQRLGKQEKQDKQQEMKEQRQNDDDEESEVEEDAAIKAMTDEQFDKLGTYNNYLDRLLVLQRRLHSSWKQMRNDVYVDYKIMTNKMEYLTSIEKRLVDVIIDKKKEVEAMEDKKKVLEERLKNIVDSHDELQSVDESSFNQLQSERNTLLDKLAEALKHQADCKEKENEKLRMQVAELKEKIAEYHAERKHL